MKSTSFSRLRSRVTAALLALVAAGAALPVHADPFVGEIRFFAGNFAPRGWAFCDGQLLSISQNQALFSVLGTMYGGNGQTSFALPDMRGRSPLHAGQGPGLSPYVLGQISGRETHSINDNELPLNPAIASGITSMLPQATPPATPPPSIDGQSVSVYSQKTPLPVDIRGPTLGVSCIIALEGIFPSRN